jgi:hypothetical protein
VRRIVLVLILVAVFVVAGYFLLRPKRSAPRAKSTKAAVQGAVEEGKTAARSAVSATRSTGSRKAGKVAGSLRASSKEERRTKAKMIRDEERRRKRALKFAEREKRRMLRGARARTGRRTTRKGGTLYVLKATVSVGTQNYALIDGRKVQVGDFVLGRKIVNIGADRIEIEAFGRRSTVLVGQSLMPTSYAPTKRR